MFNTVTRLSRGFTAKGKKSSTLWKMEHFNDPYVKEAQKVVIDVNQQNLRSRAAFKLMEINMRHNIIKKDSTVVDLGSSPGGWTQMVLEIVNKDAQKPRVFAMDVLPMDYVYACV